MSIQQFWKWSVAFASATILWGTVACNNSNNSGGGGSSNPSTTGTYYPYSGGSSLNSPVALYNSIVSTTYFGDLQMGMTMYGQSGYSLGNSPVAFQGNLILIPGNVAFCGAPAGNYSLTTTQAGQMSGTSIGPMQLVATGPVTLTLSVSYGIIESAGARVSFNFNGYVNGQPCGQVITL